MSNVRVALAAALVLAFGTAAAAADLTVNFENGAAGALPEGWKVAATNGGAQPARWAIEQAPAPHGKVLSLLTPERGGDPFNLAWLPDTKIRDVDITVAIRANTGRADQGGGLIWRARDAKNYYTARYNPLERNFRIYFVKDGSRRQIATAENLRVGTGEWFTFRIVQRGAAIEGHLNGQKVLEVRDTTFADAGGIGFWTKADAATSFDDLIVKEL